MIKIEQQLEAGRQAVGSLREGIVERSVSAYFGGLGGAAFPSEANLVEARSAARSALNKSLSSNEVLSAVCDDALGASEDHSALELRLGSLAPVLDVPPPQSSLELSAKRVGLAGAVGAVAGMTLLAPLTRIFLDMRDVGLFVGPPLGALLLILAVWHASKSKWLKGILVASLGVAAVGEAWQLLSGGGLFSTLWRRLRTRGSAFKRVLLYLAVIFVLVITRRHPRYDRQGYEATVRAAVEQWLDEAFVLLIWLCSNGGASPREQELAPAIAELGERIHALHQASQENLPVAADELIQEARNQGFEGMEGSSQFLQGEVAKTTSFAWDRQLQRRYETFGQIEPGDNVIVQKEPVVLNGVVRKKGVVRKQRKGN